VLLKNLQLWDLRMIECGIAHNVAKILFCLALVIRVFEHYTITVPSLDHKKFRLCTNGRMNASRKLSATLRVKYSMWILDSHSYIHSYSRSHFGLSLTQKCKYCTVKDFRIIL